MPQNNKDAACECLSIEQIGHIVGEIMSEKFEVRFSKLKDSVVTLMAEKLSILNEENCTLRNTLKNEVDELRGWQNDINKKIEGFSDLEINKKQIAVVHDLVNTFNGRLTEIEENSKQATQEVCEDVQSIRENICEMLTEIPQITLSSLETRFSNIEEKLSNSGEAIECKNTVSTSQTREHTPYTNPSMSTITNMCLESIESHEEFMIEVANEVDERQKRKKALVIHNIEETDNATEDVTQVTNIINKIIDDECLVKQQQVNVYRLGKRSPARNRTIKVHFKSEDFCRDVLQHTQSLEVVTNSNT